MPITVQFPNGYNLEFPDDTPQDVIDRETKRLAYNEGFDKPDLGDIFGAGVDLTQANLYSAAEGLSQELPDTELGNKITQFLTNKRQSNFGDVETVQQNLTPIRDVLSSPKQILKEQLALNSPQILGFLAASLVPRR